MSVQQMKVNDVLRRVRADYLEMPGLRVTVDEARALWGLDAVTCQELLDALVRVHFLERTTRGAYVRLH